MKYCLLAVCIANILWATKFKTAKNSGAKTTSSHPQQLKATNSVEKEKPNSNRLETKSTIASSIVIPTIMSASPSVILLFSSEFPMEVQITKPVERLPDFFSIFHESHRKPAHLEIERTRKTSSYDQILRTPTKTSKYVDRPSKTSKQTKKEHTVTVWPTRVRPDMMGKATKTPFIFSCEFGILLLAIITTFWTLF